MKRKYIKRSITVLPLLILGLFATQCTDKFEEFNTDPYGVTSEQLVPDYNNVGLPFKQIQLGIYVNDPAWNTQLQQNLIADIYSGYMTSPTPFAGNVNNQTYALVSGWNGFAWTDAYDFVMKPVAKVQEIAKDKYKDFYAWSQILKVEAMHRVTDIYGPIVYTSFGKPNADGSTDYDSQEAVYNAFFRELDEAITALTPYAQGEGNLKIIPFRPFDLAYNGSYTQWVKFANTLRLRLAIRIANVDAEKAKLEGEKSLSHPLGLLTTNDDNFLIKMPTMHPLNVFNNSWGDIRLGASMESILGGYEDPRLAKYALPAVDPVVKGQYKGIRLGINIDGKARYGDYSKLATFPNQVQLMTAAEAWFLKAEAALRGWSNAGVAQVNYETGVKTSFEQNKVIGADLYLADDTKTAKPYVDPKSIVNGQNDVPGGSPYLTDVTVKWNNAASDEEKLEKIITQKWIAMFPEGQEAWSEFRRTGYPRLFPVVKNDSEGKIPTNGFVKRIEFPANEYSTNPVGVQKAVSLLGGPDTGGTPLWWDVD